MPGKGGAVSLGIGGSFLCRASAAGFLAAGLASSALAEAEPLLIQDNGAPSAVSNSLLDSPEPIAALGSGSLGRVSLAQAVGHVSVGEDAVIPGPARYAARAQLAGSGSVISFSATPMGNDSKPVSGPGQIPLGRARLTSAFGVPRPAEGGGVRAHAGVDLAAPSGSPVGAAYAGRVASAQWFGGYGLMVVLDHGDGLQTRYAHLSRISVVPGQRVGQGQLVGLVGSTGHSTGPHLHYELRQNGRPMDPLGR